MDLQYAFLSSLFRRCASLVIEKLERVRKQAGTAGPSGGTITVPGTGAGSSS